MTPKTYHSWLGRARVRYVDAHGTTDIECCACGVMVHALDRVIRKSYIGADGKRKKKIGVSDYCPSCRAQRAATMEGVSARRTRGWGTFDYTAWAEGVLYPGVDYMALTWEERQHAYWLARVRWAQDGLYRVLMSANNRDVAVIAKNERDRLRSLRLTLARKGRRVQFSPYTDWLDAHDYAHDFGRDAGALEGGRDDVHAHGDLEGEEAA